MRPVLVVGVAQQIERRSPFGVASAVREARPGLLGNQISAFEWLVLIVSASERGLSSVGSGENFARRLSFAAAGRESRRHRFLVVADCD